MRQIKRFAALLLSAALLCVPLRAADAVVFTDVPQGSYAYKNVHRAAELRLVQGTGGGAFGLGQKISRAAYAKMLCSLMGWEPVSPAQPTFEDNRDPSRWWYSPIETACAHGAFLVRGSLFRPSEKITREEMVTAVIRALGYQMLAGTVQEDCPFGDVTTNPGYITLAYRMGLTSGVSATSFAPNSLCRREQAATVLVRAYDRMHAAVTLHKADGDVPETAVEAESAVSTAGTIPLSPRASLEAVYAAAAEAGKGGAVALHTAPYAQNVRNGRVSTGGAITSEALAELLADETTRVYRSARCESSYLLHAEPDGSQTVVWYETEGDVAAKVQLCRLLGVADVYLID